MGCFYCDEHHEGREAIMFKVGEMKAGVLYLFKDQAHKGRCANYLLADRPNVLRVFIHAPIEARQERVASYSLAWSQREVSRHIRVEDKRRSAYYRYYTGEEWRDAAAYDLSLDSEALGEEGCVEMIQKALPLFCK